MLPKITICSCTYGRVVFLQEFLWCFEQQNYSNVELIIANTFPQQKLFYDNSRVKIINCDLRPDSLGECYNIAVREAQGDFWAILDVDDWYTSNYISHRVNKLEYFKLNHIPRFFKTHDRSFNINHIEPEANNLIICDNRLDLKYPHVNHQCDIDLLYHAKSLNLYTKIDMPDNEIDFIYYFDNKAAIQSTFSNYDTMPDKITQKIKTGEEPVGKINLRPIECNPQQKIDKFLQKHDN